jgi:hypothetical protein
MVGLTITGPIATLAVGASNSTIKGTYTITKRISMQVKWWTRLWLQRKIQNNSVTDISGTTVTNDTPTDIDTNLRIALENSCSRWNRKSRWCNYVYFCSNQYRELPTRCNRNRGRFNDHWKPNATLAVGASIVQSKERTRSSGYRCNK